MLRVLLANFADLLCKTMESDLSNYDENGSWPVMLDEFVCWLRENDPAKYPTPNVNELSTYNY